MIAIGSSYLNIGWGPELGDVEADSDGLATMETLGKNVARLNKKLKK